MTTLIIIIAVVFIVSGVYLLYKSARKFNLSEEQLKRIKQRNKQLEEEEKQERD